jgi:thioredoxin-like negative regulator of GroEL
MLAQTAWKWGWRDEAIDLLWLVTKDRTKAEAALQTLYNAFIKTGDTQNLYRVLIHLFELRPDDRDIENNLAQVSLLLNLNAERGQELARDVYDKAPRNPAYASTYAFALYARGQTKDALRVFSRFSETQLRQPAIALYCGIILAAAGDSERAAAFLDLVQKENLLPEEKALFEKAQHSPAQP